MLAETVILRPVPGDREPVAALRNVTADIGLPSDEIHAYFITTVYDCGAHISISWIFYEVVFPSADDKISARERLFTFLSLNAPPKLVYVGRLKARLIACGVFRNLNDISIYYPFPFPFVGTA